MIRGKVARVLNSRELAINKGTDDGVAVGMRFAVIDPSGLNITDPDTGHILGSVARVKARVEIVSVQPRLAVGRTYDMREGRTGIADVSGLFLSTPRRAVTLSVADAPYRPLDEKDSIVKTGDPAEEMNTNDDATQSPTLPGAAELG